MMKVRSSCKIGREQYWVVDDCEYHKVGYIQPDGIFRNNYIDYRTFEEAKAVLDLFNSKRPKSNQKLEKTASEIRQFETGATRDTDVNKPSYIKALSPIALQYYVNYLGRHRVQSDGSVRDWDNWKKGIPQEVYLDGLGRHEMAVWLLCHGFPASDNHGPVTLKDSLCGVIFAAYGMLHEILQKEQQKKSEEK